MKYVLILTALLLTGCDLNEKTNDQLVSIYFNDCVSRGYTGVNINYIAGMVSSYYSCK